MSGTEIANEGGFNSWHDVARLYEDDAAAVPRLSPEAIAMVGALLEQEGCEAIMGYIPSVGTERDDESYMPIGRVLSMKAHNAMDPRGVNFRGPHILGNTYYPSGVAIWQLRPKKA